MVYCSFSLKSVCCELSYLSRLNINLHYSTFGEDKLHSGKQN